MQSSDPVGARRCLALIHIQARKCPAPAKTNPGLSPKLQGGENGLEAG